jgi:hypothetical protein
MRAETYVHPDRSSCVFAPAASLFPNPSKAFTCPAKQIVRAQALLYDCLTSAGALYPVK